MTDQTKEFTTEALMGLIPFWCTEGNLIRVDETMFYDDKERLGLILDCYVIDIDHLGKEEYDEIMYYEEWLLVDISTEVGVLEAVNSHCISPITLQVKIEEQNAKSISK